MEILKVKLKGRALYNNGKGFFLVDMEHFT